MEFLGRKIIKIDHESKEFPTKLREIPNHPKQIYCCGDTSLLYKQSVAIVGSRKYTIYGKNVANMLGNTLAKSGLVVVSGLATGIDAFSHQGMLEGCGRGIGVLGSGIRMMGPKKNYNLMVDMINNGSLIVSEYEPDFPGSPGTFPARNRIISGLSRAVVVVEANFNSGALITAQHASEQGREVYAVPGNINNQFSMGSNLLIRDGATPLVVFDDILTSMGVSVNIESVSENEYGDDEKNIINVLLAENGSAVDEISKKINKQVGETSAILTILEIKGIVESCSGRYYLKKNFS